MLASVLITTHIGLAVKYDMPDRMWKLCFHARIEQVRSLLALASSTQEERLAAVSLGSRLATLGDAVYNSMLLSLSPEVVGLSSKMLPHCVKTMVQTYYSSIELILLLQLPIVFFT